MLTLLLIVLLLMACLGIWLVVARRLSIADREDEPRADQVQLTHQVPTLQAELSMAQGELAAVQSKVLEQHLEMAQGVAARQGLLEAYPQLRSLGISGAATDPSPEWLAIRPEAGWYFPGAPFAFAALMLIVAMGIAWPATQEKRIVSSE